VLLPRQQAKLARGAKDKEHAMSQTPNTVIAVIGIDIGKNSFHVVGHDARGAIVLRQKWSRGQHGHPCGTLHPRRLATRL
jgi:transposase